MKFATGSSAPTQPVAVVAIHALGVVLTAGVIVETLVLALLGSDVQFGELYLAGMLSMLPFLAWLLYAPRRLDRADVRPARYPRIGRWVLGGIVSFVLINAALIAAIPPGKVALVVGWVRWAIVIGASVGLLIGVIEARAVERARRAERTAVRAEQLKEQRDLLDYLNSILRHEVLNTAAIVDGYATRLMDEGATLDDEEREWARVIHAEADDLTNVIDDVQVLLRTASGDHELYPVDLADLLRSEVAALERSQERVTIESDIPSSVYVRADALLSRVFGNILANAVEHTDDPDPWVGVTVTRDEGTVRVDVEDDGPGIAPDERETIFDRGRGHADTHGLGLYLVEKLVTAYDGDVYLAETGPGGSRFTVELPRSQPPADAPARETDGAPSTG
ncbi:sensor histidine kinase [Halovivax cerinus]|uniref:histidine kinase n=1 Tax=Halovivax cerinus TaxID=1487865 RepID=A0ABD5NQ64_9EURY|nr:HAMP domain-containing sensor histidine kinase [Halovivax cerinus]